MGASLSISLRNGVPRRSGAAGPPPRRRCAGASAPRGVPRPGPLRLPRHRTGCRTGAAGLHRFWPHTDSNRPEHQIVTWWWLSMIVAGFRWRWGFWGEVTGWGGGGFLLLSRVGRGCGVLVGVAVRALGPEGRVAARGTGVP